MGIKIALEWACLQVNKKNHHGVITEMVLHLSIVLLTSTKSSRFFPHRENRMLILIQTNNNLSKCLQYIHSETDVFDFNDPKTPAGYHRLGAAASYKNAPSGLDGVNFCTVEIVRPTISDTLAMTIYPYKKGINPPVWYKSGGSNEWSTLPWNVYATKSDLNSALIYRGDITGDLNRASKNGITPGYYTVGNSSTISNGPKGIAWCPFIQFYDNFHTQMIIDTTGLFVRKFAGNPAAWIDWAQYSKS